VRDRRVIVVGAGMGGLAAALELAARGCDVLVLERGATHGGKMREVPVDGTAIDAGPTVFTMRAIFDALFAAAGTSLESHLAIDPLPILARHAWSEGETLDLHADLRQSADAIGAFAGPAEARGYLTFMAAARRTFQALDRTYLHAAHPTPFTLVRDAGVRGVPDLLRMRPFTTLWGALSDHLQDPRLRQLFGRYATYCGGSPYLASATLMLIAHVEQQGVWAVRGGMQRLADAIAALAVQRGARFRYGTEVAEIATGGGRATGVTLASGERIDGDAVVFNGDIAALATGRLGPSARQAVPPLRPRAKRSLSALTWAMTARTSGLPLSRHTVFFSRDYAAEFDDLIRQRRLPVDPTVYVCAQDRDGRNGGGPAGPERLFLLVNAPASGDDESAPGERDIARCEEAVFALLARCGLALTPTGPPVVTGPPGFERLFPASGGALYGAAPHGWTSAFDRSGATTRLPGLYLAGGSVHPGPGIPMAALSGRHAAAAVLGARR
jgi:1-hydroxycarotenoid 3,4-desaturase